MVNIRKGVKEDLQDALDLIKELADYENALDEVEVTLEQLEQDGFGDKPLFHFLIAEKDNKTIGLSFYWFRYSTWKGKFLFLEDFIVKEEYRREGIGNLLFKNTLKICQQEKCNGMIWQVLDWNTPAINFYKKHNATISSAWLNGKLTKEQINQLLKKMLKN